MAKAKLERWQWILVAGTVVLVALYIGALLLSSELRRDYFLQKLAGPIFMGGTAILFFSVVPSTAHTALSIALRGTVGLTGAAAFYMLALPITMDALFPKDVIVDGYVYFQTNSQANEGLRPVQGASVEIPETGQTYMTDERGRFSFVRLAFKPNQLKVTYGGRVYNLDLREYGTNDYPIIPLPTEPERSAVQHINPDEWEESNGSECLQRIRSGGGCPTVSMTSSENRSLDARLLTLRRGFAAADGYTRLYLRINLPEEGETQIIDAQKLEPAPGIGREVQEGERCQARQWWIPVSGGEQTVKLSVCLAQQRGRSASGVSLQTAYWYEK